MAFRPDSAARVRSEIRRRSFSASAAEVEHEGIRVSPEFRDDEGHPLSHQSGDERDVAREPVQLGYDDRALGPAGGGKGVGEVRAPVERVLAFLA